MAEDQREDADGAKAIENQAHNVGRPIVVARRSARACHKVQRHAGELSSVDVPASLANWWQHLLHDVSRVANELSPKNQDRDRCALHWHGTRLHLHLATVMPNHVYLLLTPLKKDQSTVALLAGLCTASKTTRRTRFSDSEAHPARSGKRNTSIASYAMKMSCLRMELHVDESGQGRLVQRPEDICYGSGREIACAKRRCR